MPWTARSPLRGFSTSKPGPITAQQVLPHLLSEPVSSPVKRGNTSPPQGRGEEQRFLALVARVYRQEYTFGHFPGAPVAKTAGSGFDVWWGN